MAILLNMDKRDNFFPVPVLQGMKHYMDTRRIKRTNRSKKN
jgi:hypothetical protein